ncbi:MAG: hypothetical protein AAFO69_02155 [Bacteroidota bacterium]
MKTYNNTKNIIKTTSTFAIAFCLTIASVFAGTTHGDSVKIDSKVNKEEAVVIEDILAEFEKAAEMEQLIEIAEETFEIYDQNDQLVFSGSKAQWEDEQNTNVTALKRKAEFLFEMEGANVYKVF